MPARMEIGGPHSWSQRDPVAYYAQARRERVACVDLKRGESLTYGELDALAARCAGALAAAIAEPHGARIVTLLRNGLDAVVLMIACERVGAIYTPLNWRLAGPEIAGLFEDCAPALAVVEEEFAAAASAALERFGGPVFMVSPGRSALREAAERSTPLPSRAADPGAPAVILYTSGTTGRPKGVVLSREAVFWGAFNFATVGEVGPDSVMLCDTPMFHTVGLVATCRTVLFRGGRLILSDRFLPGATLERLSDPALGVTHYFGVPQIAQMLCDDPGYAAADLTRLKGLFLGGAPLPPPLCQRLLDDGVLVVNGYGMTESSTIAGMPLDAAAIRQRPASAGLVAPVMDLAVVGADGVAAPIGEVGEIWLRGPALTSGYWGQPEATAAAFQDGWFRTGDAGRLDKDGHLFLVDRWKDMYISGGENVYPAEVEAMIASLPGVREVGVVGSPDARWGEVGCAFVVCAAGAGLSDADVLRHCAGRLARYKQPTKVRFVDALPRTASGKIRKDVLRRQLTVEI